MVVNVNVRQKVFEGISEKGQDALQDLVWCDDLSTLRTGDKVEYWSKTHGHYVEAEVLSVHFNEAGEITKVDLTCKTRADLSKIRKKAPPAPLFNVGDSVQYWSDTHGRSMDAKVVKVHEDGLYDLDVKKGAQASKIKPMKPLDISKQDASAITEVQDEKPVESDPADEVSKSGENPTLVAQSQGSPEVAAPAAISNANSEVSTAASLIASGVPYRELPADMIFLGSGLEFAPKRKGHTLSKRFHEGGYCASKATGGLLAGDLVLDNDVFDPSEPRLREQLAEKLGSFSCIEQMKGFSGGLNEGVWFMYGEEDLALKLVKCQRIACNVPTEAENLERVFQEHPGIGADETIAFPVKLCGCFLSDGSKKYDLIVMRKIPGERLAEVLSKLYHAKQEPVLHAIWYAVGQQLAAFHDRYQKQHGDFQPFNIFYDEESGAIRFIDVGGMGIPTMDNDKEHLREAMTLLKSGYGESLLDALYSDFSQGYDAYEQRKRGDGCESEEQVRNQDEA